MDLWTYSAVACPEPSVYTATRKQVEWPCVRQARPAMVFHAGGVIWDAPLAKQTMAGLRETLAPKWDAARRLETL